MTIPTQGCFHRIVLGVMLDGNQRTPKQIREAVLPTLSLTEEERVHKTERGQSPLWAGRTDWSTQYLQRAKLLTRISRGLYEITDEGRELYKSGKDGNEISNYVDKLIAERDPWNVGARTEKKKDTPEATQLSDMAPEEAISKMEDELNADLASQLIELIMERDPDFFEKVVVDLLESMGYGTGEVTQHSSDGGIDGLITTDELGFRPIMTQAKRYKPEHSIGRPEIQSFVGALNGANGVFITTSSFTKSAIECVESCKTSIIALIDGKRLTELMIKYNLGVSTIRTVDIKRIDSDYFEA